MSSTSCAAPAASPRRGRRINGPFFRPSGVRSSSKRASSVLLSQKRNLESASGMMSEALYSSLPFTSPKGMGAIVNSPVCACAKLGETAPVVSDLEQPAETATQSAISDAPARKATAVIPAGVAARRLDGFKSDLILLPLQQPCDKRRLKQLSNGCMDS